MRWRSLILLIFPLLLLPAFLGSTAAQSALLVQKTWGGISTDIAQDVAVDSSGNIYVTGYAESFSSPAYPHVFLLKYNPFGNLFWSKTWGGSSYDFGDGVAVDASGNVYVTGSTQSFGSGGSDVFLLKFNATGSLVSQWTWGSSGNDVGRAVALDSSGDVYVLGYTNSFGQGGNDLFILKLDSSGNLLVQETWGGSGDDSGNDVALDLSGNIYVTGSTDSFGGVNHHVFLLRLNSTGGLLWSKLWNGSSYDYGYGVAVDGSGNIFVTGQTYSFGAGGYDVSLLKFNSTGALHCQETWGGSKNDFGVDVAVDKAGNVYVVSTTFSYGGNLGDVALLKFDSSCNLLWSKIWGGSGDNLAGGVALDAAGDVIVAGGVSSPPTSFFKTTGNQTLGFPPFSSGPINGTLGTPSFVLGSPGASARTPIGSEYYAGEHDVILFKYGLLPAITFKTNPTVGGIITFAGTNYTDSMTDNYTYGAYVVSATAPLHYTFTEWSTTGGIRVYDNSSNTTTVTITGSGTLTANFTSKNSTSITPELSLLTALVTTTILTLKRRRLASRT